eukprot:2015232-Karenia_brevis.AAC.1
MMMMMMVMMVMMMKVMMVMIMTDDGADDDDDDDDYQWCLETALSRARTVFAAASACHTTLKQSLKYPPQ